MERLVIVYTDPDLSPRGEIVELFRFALARDLELPAAGDVLENEGVGLIVKRRLWSWSESKAFEFGVPCVDIEVHRCPEHPAFPQTGEEEEGDLEPPPEAR